MRKFVVLFCLIVTGVIGTMVKAQDIIKAVQDGKLDVKVLDRNGERILNLMLLSPRFKGYKYSNKPDLKAHALVTRQAATEGMVLLKNKNAALPLEGSVKKIAAFGSTSYDIITGGTGSGDGNEAYSVSLVDGLKNAGYSVNENLQAMYLAYLNATKEGRPKRRGFMMGAEPIPELSLPADLINSMVNTCDAALITLGRNAGEGRDRSPDEGDFQLTAAERNMIKLVSEAFQAKGKKVVVILNVSGVLETASWKELPDAILLSQTDKDLVKMEIDLAWAAKAKQNPKELFKGNPGRFPLWHVKDYDLVNNKIVGIGHGSVDFKPTFAQAKLAGMKYFFYEQDSAKSMDDVSLSYNNLKKII